MVGWAHPSKWVNVVGERLGGPDLQVSTMLRQIILAGFVAVVPTVVQAQARGMAVPVSHAMAAAPRVAMPAPHAGVSPMMSAPRMALRGGTGRPRMGVPVVRSTRRPINTRRRIDGLNNDLRPGCNSAPGLGFDAVHQAAVCGSTNFGLQGRGLQVPLFFPFFDGGFFLPGSQSSVDENSAAENAQAEDADVEAREMSRRRRAAPPTPATTPPAETASTALPDNNEEYVFVRRDGTVFFAVGYAWEDGTLRYITSQGMRHTVKQDALDLGATQQFNEQRGLSFRLPA